MRHISDEEKRLISHLRGLHWRRVEKDRMAQLIEVFLNREEIRYNEHIGAVTTEYDLFVGEIFIGCVILSEYRDAAYMTVADKPNRPPFEQIWRNINSLYVHEALDHYDNELRNSVTLRHETTNQRKQ